MKKLSMFALLVLFCGSLVLAMEDTETTVKGEIVDLACYLKSGAKGEKHRQCAASCLQNGMPMGILAANGKLYLLLENHSKKEPYAKAKKHAADVVSITGKLVERDGMKGLTVEAVSK